MIYRIALVDDHQVVLESLANLLSTVDAFDVVGTASTGRALLTLLDEQWIDVLITDLVLPDIEGLALVTAVRAKCPQVGVLICSGATDQTLVGDAIRAGANGYVTKTADKSELFDAILAVASGKTYVDNRVFSLPTPQPLTLTDTPLTPRELEIVSLILDELSSTEIAERLFISFNTVETHRKRIYHKIGVTTSLGLMKYALQHGLSSHLAV